MQLIVLFGVKIAVGNVLTVQVEEQFVVEGHVKGVDIGQELLTYVHTC